jgi:hypothetical protein
LCHSFSYVTFIGWCPCSPWVICIHICHRCLTEMLLQSLKHLSISELPGLWTFVWHSKKQENTIFQKLDLFPSSGERETPPLLGPLERANLNHWIQFSKRCVLWFLECWMMDMV